MTATVASDLASSPLPAARSRVLPKGARFLALLRREWLQHRVGYGLMLAAPALLVLLAVIAVASHHGHVVVAGMPLDRDQPLGALAVSVPAVIGLVVTVAWFTVGFQLPGLARRDQQDRSIEFWSSLPVSHTASIGALVLLHAFLVPLAALVVGAAAGLLVGLIGATAIGGVALLGALPWGWIALDVVALVAAVGFGMVLATLWVAPIGLAYMVASSAFKRWGIGVLTIGAVLHDVLLKQLYGVQALGATLSALGQHARQAIVPDGAAGPKGAIGAAIGEHVDGVFVVLQTVPGILADNAARAVADLASPLFGLSLAASAALFALLVWLRRRSAAA